MKKRVFLLLNFAACNLLFFALYLNFVKKDAMTVPVVNRKSATEVKNVSFSQNEISLPENASQNTGIQHQNSFQQKNQPLKLSMN